MNTSSPLLAGEEFAKILQGLHISHVVWIPDSATGEWEAAMEKMPELSLLRVCREGEAWPLAAGLLLAGQAPVVVMQSTGLFESGDALRNILHDLRLPLFAIVGARNWLIKDSPDSARRFIEPILQAWQVEYDVVECRNDHWKIAARYEFTRREQRPGFVVLAEGKG